MGRILIIGAGGVGNVAVKKCAQIPEVFGEIMLASRTLGKCEKIRDEIREKYGREIKVAKVDADNVSELVKLIDGFKPDIVVNVALPYQDLVIMEACLQTGVHYLDTANYEAPDEAKFEYKQQWAYHERFKEKGIMAILGCGFDPGVSNIFCAYAQKHLFDEIKTIDIVDCNAGSHGKGFATNFNPEINLREFLHNGKYWKDGKWVETPPILSTDCVHFPFDYPIAGPKESYLIWHEEMESLVKHIKGLERIRFWMTFSENYLNYFRVLHSVGLTRIDEVDYNGCKIVPIKFLKALLPDPGTLGTNYSGKTVIGCVMDGIKGGQPKKIFIYNVCDHTECYNEVQAQAVSYTAGVPPIIGAMMVITGVWKGAGVFNVEQLDPDEFMDALNKYGLPWVIENFKGEVPQ
ncbi:saccharopine dehydrogenase family protein [Candidatus Micrarchaeota archaeon]|nr:saccharopine dehydrogenase family protein [Candidatus Micrarchaeota archaeon]